MAAWVGPAIQAAGSVLGGLLGGRGSSRGQNFQEDAYRETFQWDVDKFTNAIRYRVGDAKAAGVHPLFALGGSVGGGSGAQIPFADSGQATSGSWLQDGLESLGGAADAWLTEQDERRLRADAHREQMLERDMALQLHQAQVHKLEADTARSLAESQYYSSRAKTAATIAAAKPGTPAIAFQPGQQVAPPGQGAPRLANRPTDVGNKASVPMMIEYIRPDGSTAQAINPALGWDEIGQAFGLAQEARDMVSDSFLWWHNLFSGEGK